MPTISIPDESKYGQALSLLYKWGGMFQTRDPDVLIIGRTQLRALEEAGLISPSNGNSRDVAIKRFDPKHPGGVI